MLKLKALPAKDPVKRWILFEIPVLFLISPLMHFIYDWSQKSVLVGIVAPVNESVWEHLKLIFWPMIIWWSVGYFILKRKIPVSATNWFVSCTVALLVNPLVIISFFYSYTGAFGIESLFLDIFSLFLSLILGQILALHIYKYAKIKHGFLYVSIFIIVLLVVFYTISTFSPVHIPLFRDSTTGNYGRV